MLLNAHKWIFSQGIERQKYFANQLNFFRFIKSTEHQFPDHRPTDHWPLTRRPTGPSALSQRPSDPGIAHPADYLNDLQ